MKWSRVINLWEYRPPRSDKTMSWGRGYCGRFSRAGRVGAFAGYYYSDPPEREFVKCPEASGSQDGILISRMAVRLHCEKKKKKKRVSKWVIGYQHIWLIRDRWKRERHAVTGGHWYQSHSEEWRFGIPGNWIEYLSHNGKKEGKKFHN